MSLKKKFFISFVPSVLYLGGCFVYLWIDVFADRIDWLFVVLTVLAIIGAITFFTLMLVESSLALFTRYSNVLSDRVDKEEVSVGKRVISAVMYFVFTLVTVIAYFIATMAGA